MKLFMCILFACVAIGCMVLGYGCGNKVYLACSLIWMFSSGICFANWLYNLIMK